MAQIKITSLSDYIENIEKINEPIQCFDSYMDILKGFISEIDEYRDDERSLPQLVREKGNFLYRTTFLVKEILNLVSSLSLFKDYFSSENIDELIDLVDKSVVFSKKSKYFPEEEYCLIQEKLAKIKKGNKSESKFVSPIYFFYRGEASKDWLTLPSVMRNNESFSRETFYFHEMQVRAPKEFENMTSFGKLAKMQHYSVPTRLLDITLNPLNALYFACDDDFVSDEVDGKVVLFPVLQGTAVYEDADKALILSSLPHLTAFEQEKLMNEIVFYNKKMYDSDPVKPCLNKLFLEICAEKPAFQPRIKFGDILNPLFVQPNMSNLRIANQRGAFLLSGLSSDLEEAKNKIKARMAKTSFIIPAKCKKKDSWPT